MSTIQIDDYQRMDPTQLSAPDLARWEIWSAVERSGRTMRQLSLQMGTNSGAINQLLTRTEFTPQPATLRALTAIDVLGLSYMRLMVLFGHVDPPSRNDEVMHDLAPIITAFASVPRAKRPVLVGKLVQFLEMING